MNVSILRLSNVITIASPPPIRTKMAVWGSFLGVQCCWLMITHGMLSPPPFLDFQMNKSFHVWMQEKFCRSSCQAKEATPPAVAKMKNSEAGVFFSSLAETDHKFPCLDGKGRDPVLATCLLKVYGGGFSSVPFLLRPVENHFCKMNYLLKISACPFHLKITNSLKVRI